MEKKERNKLKSDAWNLERLALSSNQGPMYICTMYVHVHVMVLKYLQKIEF
jgi:hypothetical protein